MDKFLLGFFSFGWLRGLDFLAPLALRLYLAPMFWVSGSTKLGLFSGSVTWYDPTTWYSSDAIKAASSGFDGGIFSEFASSFLTVSIRGLEVVGAILLVLGFAVRWVTIPLIFIVGLVGYAALAGKSLIEVGTSFLMSHGYTSVATDSFEVIVVNIIMLFTLFFIGAGRFLSVDWFIAHGYYNKIEGKKKVVADDEDIFADDAKDDEIKM